MKPLRCGLLLLVVLLLGGGCKPGNAQTSAAKVQIASKIAAIRQAGDPVTLSEFNAWYAEPVAAENAAPIYAEAFAALTTDDPTQPEALARNQKVLALLHQAAMRPKCRYPVDLTKGTAIQLPHLSKFKSSLQLVSQSASNHVANGQLDLATQALLDGLCLVRSLAQEPLLISHLVQIAGGNLILAGVETTLSRQDLPESALKQLQTVVGEAEREMTLTRSLKGDRCTGLFLFELSPAEQARIFKATGGPPAPARSAR